jgi:hypothetical protein
MAEGGRRIVTSGRYSKLRDKRSVGNMWELLDTGSENGTEDRRNDRGRSGSTRDGGRKSMSMEVGGGGETEGQIGVETDGERDGMEESREESRDESRKAGRKDTTKKRNLDERSPGVHDNQRVSRKRMDEFELGELFDGIVNKMKRDVSNLIEKAPESFRRELRDGLEIMMEGMRGIMNGVSDGVAGERKAREAEEMRTEDKIEKMGEEITELKNISNGMVSDRMEQQVRVSEKEMEDKVRQASCNLKILDIDFGESSEDRGWMVRTALSYMRGDVYPEDRGTFERIIRRTRIVVMGRKTTSGTYRGRTIYTVPVLLECQNKGEASELDEILRRAGYFSAFHWPKEMVEFVGGVREEVRKMGYKDNTHYIRIRPEERDGMVQIRADVKERNGVRFQAKAVWQCPPHEQAAVGKTARHIRA